MVKVNVDCNYGLTTEQIRGLREYAEATGEKPKTSWWIQNANTREFVNVPFECRNGGAPFHAELDIPCGTYTLKVGKYDVLDPSGDTYKSGDRKRCFQSKVFVVSDDEIEPVKYYSKLTDIPVAPICANTGATVPLKATGIAPSNPVQPISGNVIKPLGGGITGKAPVITKEDKFLYGLGLHCAFYNAYHERDDIRCNEYNSDGTSCDENCSTCTNHLDLFLIH